MRWNARETESQSSDRRTTSYRLETKHPSRNSPNSRLWKKFRIECHVNTESCAVQALLAYRRKHVEKHEISLRQKPKKGGRSRGPQGVSGRVGDRSQATATTNDRTNSYRIPCALSGDTVFRVADNENRWRINFSAGRNTLVLRHQNSETSTLKGILRIHY